MHNKNPSVLLKFWQRSCKFLLPTCWLLGLIAGMIVAAGAGDTFSLMMRGVDFSAVSIPGLLMVTFLPFLLTAIAVIYSQPWLLLAVILFKSFSFGYCAFGIMAVYGTASWLIRFLLMFTDGCSLPLLMWLWLRHGDLSKKPIFGDFSVCTAVALALGILDICAVSPFAAMIL